MAQENSTCGIVRVMTSLINAIKILRKQPNKIDLRIVLALHSVASTQGVSG